MKIICNTAVWAVLILLLSSSTKAQLTGTYTIDQIGPGGDYSSFSAAVADLATQGVSGPVTFELAPGSGPYTEQLTITAGGTPSAPVVFNGNGEEIRYQLTTNTTRHIVKFSGAKHISFNDLVVRAIAGAPYAWGFHIADGAGDIEITDCHIIVPDPPSSSDGSSCGVVISNSSIDPDGGTGSDSTHNVSITGNTIEGGSYGITVAGNGVSYTKNVIIDNNNVLDNAWRGINLIWVENFTVNGNTITPKLPGASVGAEGISTNLCRGTIQINGNTIPNPTWSGIEVSAIGYPNPVQVYNNAVGGGSRSGSFLSRGIVVVNSQNVQLWHNSIRMDNGAARCLETVGSNTNLDIRNNAFSALGGSNWSFFLPERATCLALNSGGITSLDYNNYYTDQGGDVANSGGTRYTNLADLIAVGGILPSGHDVNSTQVNPYHISSLDLHAQSVAMDGNGLPGLVSTDIDGESRSPFTPDMGADEFTPVANNAIAISIVSPSTGAAPDTLPIQVVVGNLGSALLDNLELSGVVNSDYGSTAFGPVSLSGLGLGFEQTSTVLLANFPFETGRYDIEVWTSNPNGAADEVPSNDTTSVSQLLFCTSFSGTYIVDQTATPGGNVYNDLQTLIDLMNDCGVSGPVTIEVTAGSGPYFQQLNIPNITGSGSPATIVTINGNGNRWQHTASNAADGFIWKMSGIDYLTVNDIHFKAGSGSPAMWNVWVNNSNTNLTFKNCTFENLPNKGANLAYAGFGASASLGTLFGPGTFDLLIEDCTFMKGSRGVAGGGNAVYRNNIFSDQEFYSLDLENGSTVLIEDNLFTYYNVPASGSCMKILSVGSPIIRNNQGYEWKNTAIFLDNINSFAGPEGAKVENNIFSTNTIGSGSSIVGIQIDGAQGVDIFNNSFNIKPASFTTAYGIWSSSTSGSNFRFVNNSFFIEGTSSGRAMRLADLSDVTVCDYNNWSTTTATIFQEGCCSNYSSLSSWQGATGFDNNSLQLDPQYEDDSDLHLMSSSPLIDAGTTAYGPPLDFEGGTRPDAVNLLTDIGADEFGSSLAGCPAPANPAMLLVSTTSAQLYWDPVSEAIQYHIQGRRVPGGTQNVYVASNTPSFSVFQPGTTYQWRVQALCTNDTSVYSEPVTFTTNSLREGEIASMQVTPNPANDFLDIRVQNWDQARNNRAILFNSAGVQVRETRLSGPSSRMMLGDLPAGLYLLELRGEDGFETVKELIVVTQ